MVAECMIRAKFWNGVAQKDGQAHFEIKNWARHIEKAETYAARVYR